MGVKPSGRLRSCDKTRNWSVKHKSGSGIEAEDVISKQSTVERKRAEMPAHRMHTIGDRSIL